MHFVIYVYNVFIMNETHSAESYSAFCKQATTTRLDII